MSVESHVEEPTPDAGGSTDSAVDPARKRGAPSGNENSRRHGLYSPRSPAGCTYIDRQANLFRSHLEARVFEVHGGVTILHAGLIQTACEATKSAMRIAKVLEDRSLTVEQRLAAEGKRLTALDMRDRKIAQLGLDRDEGNFSDLYSRPWLPASPSPAGPPDDTAPEPSNEK